MNDIFAKIKAEREKQKQQGSPQTVGTAGGTAVVPTVAETPTAVDNSQGVSSPKESSEIMPPASPPTEPQKPAEAEKSEVTPKTETASAVNVSSLSPPSIPTAVQQQTVICKPQFTANFDLSPVTVEQGTGVMIYGPKGTGKTTLAYTFDGDIAVLSFDHQSNIIKISLFNNDPRITVYDALRYYSEVTPEDILQSAEITFRYILALFEEIKKKQPDWIVIDGLEFFKEMCEYKMRGNNNLQPFENFANWGFWHERTMYMDQIDRRAKEIAKKGVIYTSYITYREVKDNTGAKVLQEPKWAGNIKTRTRIVIKVEADNSNEGRTFYAQVESSKDNTFPTGGKKVVGKVSQDGKTTIEGIKALKVVN